MTTLAIGLALLLIAAFFALPLIAMIGGLATGVRARIVGSRHDGWEPLAPETVPGPCPACGEPAYPDDHFCADCGCRLERQP